MPTVLVLLACAVGVGACLLVLAALLLAEVLPKLIARRCRRALPSDEGA